MQVDVRILIVIDIIKTNMSVVMGRNDSQMLKWSIK